MRRAATSFALVVAFLVGCVAARAVIPPARAGTTPQRWEYLCDTFSGFATVKGLQETMNKGGAEGWELVTIATGNIYCFKRPLP